MNLKELNALDANYGTTKDEVVRDLLANIVEVQYLAKESLGKMGYYGYPEKEYAEMINNPRGVSLAWKHWTPVVHWPHLKVLTEITVLTKGEHCKPTMGEVFDQMDSEMRAIARAVYIDMKHALKIEQRENWFVVRARILI